MPPVSPVAKQNSVPIASGSSSSLQRGSVSTGNIVNGVTPKKILNKAPTVPVASSSSSSSSTSNVPIPRPPPHPQQILHQQPPPRAPQPLLPIPTHLPQTPIMYTQQQIGMMPPALSPRMPSYPPGPYAFGGPTIQQQPARFAPSPAFDPAFQPPRGPATPVSPIGPPSKPKTPLVATSSSSIGRRGSIPPGPITRPLAPIARPTNNANVNAASGENGSRSPSPKGLLGSSALAADDDEVVAPATAGRRSTMPHMWSGGAGAMNANANASGSTSNNVNINHASPRGDVGMRAPWGAPPGFGRGGPMQMGGMPGGMMGHSIQPPPPHSAGIPTHIPTHGGGMPIHQLHPHPPPTPIGQASMWSTNTPGNGDWHTPGGVGVIGGAGNGHGPIGGGSGAGGGGGNGVGVIGGGHGGGYFPGAPFMNATGS